MATLSLNIGLPGDRGERGESGKDGQIGKDGPKGDKGQAGKSTSTECVFRSSIFQPSVE